MFRKKAEAEKEIEIEIKCPYYQPKNPVMFNGLRLDVTRHENPILDEKLKQRKSMR